jgi:hypothetical protein
VRGERRASLSSLMSGCGAPALPLLGLIHPSAWKGCSRNPCIFQAAWAHYICKPGGSFTFLFLPPSAGAPFSGPGFFLPRPILLPLFTNVLEEVFSEVRQGFIADSSRPATLLLANELCCKRLGEHVRPKSQAKFRPKPDTARLLPFWHALTRCPSRNEDHDGPGRCRSDPPSRLTQRFGAKTQTAREY